MPQKHEIKIVVEDGALSYENENGNGMDGILVHPTDLVSWKCDSHDYGIQFTSNLSPFQDGVLSLGKNKGRSTDAYTVKKPPRRGRVAFKYAVSVHIPGNDNPILIDDPVIIVEDA